MAHTTIKKIVKEELTGNGKLWITTIEFDDGGEILQATGVGRNLRPHTPIITYFDDRYNKVKFQIDASPAHASRSDTAVTP